MSTLGIDFGTTNSSASYIDSVGKPRAVRFIGHDLKMPSVISFYGGNPMFGYEAKYMLDNIYQLPSDEQKRLFATTIQSIKRKLDSKAMVAGHSHQDIISLFLKHIREQAQKASTPMQFDKLVLTHPVQFEEWQKTLLKDAAIDAGFDSVELLEEPVSAALGYLKSEDVQEEVKGMLVYDFGGGTFDVAYVTKQEGKFIVPIPPKGNSCCGGDDIDQAIYDYVINKARTVIGDEYAERRDLGLFFQCRRWKEMLSSMDNFPISVRSKKNPVLEFSHMLERRELDILSKPIIDTTINLTKCVYDEVKENRLPLDFILLIGGSSCMPIIKDRLKQCMPELEIRTTGTADIAVALGASYHAVKPVVVNPEDEWCFCMYDGKRILKTYNFCIYCGKPNYFKTGRL